jgi:hypothetical protein
VVEYPVAQNGTSLQTKNSKETSIVNYLASQGFPSDKSFRKKLASQYNIENYDFSAKKNLQLLSELKKDQEPLVDFLNGKVQKPSIKEAPKKTYIPPSSPFITDLKYKKPNEATDNTQNVFKNTKVNSNKQEEENILKIAADNIEKVSGKVVNKAKETINKTKDELDKYYNLGTSWIDRRYKMMKGDDESTVVKNIDFTKSKPVTNTKENIEDSKFDPIITGNKISDEKDTKHRGAGFYHTNEIIDLDKFKFGFHNREGQGSTTDKKSNTTKAEGLIIPVFAKEYGEVGDDNKGKNSIRKYKDSEIRDTKLYGGIDDKGKFQLDYGKNLKGKNLSLADFRYADVKSFAKDKNGNFVLGDETGNSAIAKVPHLITTDNKEIPLNVLVPKKGKDQHLKYGDVTGGRMIITTPDLKYKHLVSGSLDNLNTTLEEFKKRYKTESVKVVFLDNGTFARGMRKTDKTFRKDDWKKYDTANEMGGAGFYYYEDGGTIEKDKKGWLEKYN